MFFLCGLSLGARQTGANHDRLCFDMNRLAFGYVISTDNPFQP
jgi:hypothetical protein